MVSTSGVFDRPGRALVPTVLFVCGATMFLAAIRSPAQTGSPEQAVAEKAAADSRPVFAMDVEPLWQYGALWGFAFLIEVTPFDVGLPPQLLMLDTGSSTLAFCNASLAQGQSPLIATYEDNTTAEVIACNAYGNGSPPESFWGFIYSSKVVIGPAGFAEAKAYFNVMQQHKGMTCSSDGFVVGGGRQLEGIFGIGSKAQNVVRAMPKDGMVTNSDGLPDCSKALIAGAVKNPLDGLLDSPATAPLNLSLIGIRWQGRVGKHAGTLFLGESAKSNEFYRKEDAIGPASLNTQTLFELNVTGFQTIASNGSISQSLPFVSGAQNAYIDTGTAELVLPPALIEILKHDSSLGDGLLSVKLAAKDGGELSLDFPFAQLRQMYNASQLIKSQDAHTDKFVFGAICWLFFDLVVVDVEAQEVTFVPVADYAKVVVPPMPVASVSA